MIPEFKGTLRLDHFGRAISIDYTMNVMGGYPNIYITDKHGHQHSFHYRRGEWLYGCTRGPGWQPDFLMVLYAAFDIERERHGL